MPSERNVEIGRLYKAGKTQQEIADIYHVSEMRIGQIIRAIGMTKHDRPKRSQLVRASFTAVLLTKDDKKAIQVLSKNEGKSVSEWVSDLIKRELVKRKISLLNEIDVPLPLEAE